MFRTQDRKKRVTFLFVILFKYVRHLYRGCRSCRGRWHHVLLRGGCPGRSDWWKQNELEQQPPSFALAQRATGGADRTWQRLGYRVPVQQWGNRRVHGTVQWKMERLTLRLDQGFRLRKNYFVKLKNPWKEISCLWRKNNKSRSYEFCVMSKQTRSRPNYLIGYLPYSTVESLKSHF